MQLKVFVTKLVKLNVFVFYVNLHDIQGLNLDEMLSIQLHGIGIKTKPSGEKSRTATHWVN